MKSATNAKMKRNSILMVYLKTFKWTNHFNYTFTYAFDSLSGTDIMVSLNAMTVHFPLVTSDFDVKNECGALK